MAKKRRKFPQVLLVEGKDDEHVIYAFAVQKNLPHNFEVTDCRGIDKLFELLPVQLKESDIETVGVLVDADTEAAARWQKLRHVLQASYSDLPVQLPTTGLVVPKTTTAPRIGVWVMPDNRLKGMLEDFLLFLVPPEDDLLERVEQFLENIEKEQLHGYINAHRSKARIHAWLSLQDDPGTPLGLAITKRYLSLEDEHAKAFENWLRRLFNEDV